MYDFSCPYSSRILQTTEILGYCSTAYLAELTRRIMRQKSFRDTADRTYDHAKNTKNRTSSGVRQLHKRERVLQLPWPLSPSIEIFCLITNIWRSLVFYLFSQLFESAASTRHYSIWGITARILSNFHLQSLNPRLVHTPFERETWPLSCHEDSDCVFY